MKKIHVVSVVLLSTLFIVVGVALRNETDELRQGLREETRQPGNISGVPPVKDNKEGLIAPSAIEMKQLVLRGRESSSTLGSDSKGVEITLFDLSMYEVGDEIALLIPQEDRVYKGGITDAQTTAAGNRVITGFFDGSLKRQRFIFTVGSSQTFGTLQTSEGRYQLETRNGVGRIISVVEINEGLDFSKPDFRIPQRRESALDNKSPKL